MDTYTISNTKLNPNRIFILPKNELEKRFDPFYYVPGSTKNPVKKTGFFEWTITAYLFTKESYKPFNRWRNLFRHHAK